MKLLEDKILKEGRVIGTDILKVDCFLNHQIDVALLEEMGMEWKRLFEQEKITRVLTIEASGIALACFAARAFQVPMVFAKKSHTRNQSDQVYTSEVYSYTHETTYQISVDKKYILPGDRVLIVDDFLANGKALNGLVDLINQAGAEVAGVGIAVEKSFQGGGDELRKKGIRIESLARVAAMSEENGVEFVK